MTTATQPTSPALAHARTRREAAQREAERLLGQEQELKGQLSRALADRDVTVTVTRKEQLAATEAALLNVVQSFPALDADVATAARHAAAYQQRLVPVLREARLAFEEFDVALARFREARERALSVIPHLGLAGREAGDATAGDTVVALRQLVEDVIARRVYGNGHPAYDAGLTKMAAQSFRTLEMPT